MTDNIFYKKSFCLKLMNMIVFVFSRPAFPRLRRALPAAWSDGLLEGEHRNDVNHLPLDKMAAISQKMLSNAFSWMKSCVLWLNFRRSLFPRVQLMIFQHWFRKWLGAEKATSHYLNQCWPDSLTHICGTRGRWVKHIFMNLPQRTGTNRKVVARIASIPIL